MWRDKRVEEVQLRSVRSFISLSFGPEYERQLESLSFSVNTERIDANTLVLVALFIIEYYENTMNSARPQRSAMLMANAAAAAVACSILSNYEPL